MILLLATAHAGAPFSALATDDAGGVVYADPGTGEIHVIRDGADRVLARVPPARDGRRVYRLQLEPDGSVLVDGWRIAADGRLRQAWFRRPPSRPAARDSDGSWVQATDASGWTRLERVGVAELPTVYPRQITGLAARNGALAVLVLDEPSVRLSAQENDLAITTPHATAPFGVAFSADGSVLVLEVSPSGATCVSRTSGDRWEPVSSGCAAWAGAGG